MSPRRRPAPVLLLALLLAQGTFAPPVDAHPPARHARPVAAWQAPASFEEAVRRLAAARERLAATGRVPLRYTEDQLRENARTNRLGDTRWLVRLVPRKPDDKGLLGFPRPFGKMPIWVTTFEQLEPADTDPEAITRLFGLNVDPKAEYHLLLLRDLGADEARRPELVCPTRERLAALAARDLAVPGITAADFADVLAKDYRIPYHRLMDAFYARGFREYIPDDVEKFIADTPALRDDAAAQKRFRVRLRVHSQFGASEWFRGNGATFMTGGGKRELGVNEIFLLDPAPKPIGAYAARGQVVAVPCTPLAKPGPLAFAGPDGR